MIQIHSVFRDHRRVFPPSLFYRRPSLLVTPIGLAIKHLVVHQTIARDALVVTRRWLITSFVVSLCAAPQLSSWNHIMQILIFYMFYIPTVIYTITSFRHAKDQPTRTSDAMIFSPSPSPVTTLLMHYVSTTFFTVAINNVQSSSPIQANTVCKRLEE